jgi:hypothetical protein
MNPEVKKYLAEIGRKGGKATSPRKKYASNAERQKAYRARKKAEIPPPTANWGTVTNILIGDQEN